jgi:hypothetical protein
MWDYLSAIIAVLITVLINGWMVPMLFFTKYLQVSELTEDTKVNNLREKLKGKTAMMYNGKPSGLFILFKPFAIGTISVYARGLRGDMEEKALFISSRESYKVLISNNIDTHDESKKTITLYERNGSYQYFWYDKRIIEVDRFAERPSQTAVLDKIIHSYEKRKSNAMPYITVFVWGDPGSGKSALGILLAIRLSASVIYSFDPSDPGDTLAKLYRKCKPSAEKPLAIVLDEVDVMLMQKIHVGVHNHKDVPTQIHDKCSWNQFFDRFDLGLYEHILIIMNSNKDPGSINDLDPSYLRKGRTHKILRL